MLDHEERWLTYAEAGELLGISTEAARALARRQKWSRRTPNEHNAFARVLVPADRPVARPRPAVTRGMNGGHPGNGRGTEEWRPPGYDRPDEGAGVLRSTIRTLENAVEVLRDQLGTANRRADDERARAAETEQQIAALQAEMVEIRVSAELAEYATGKAAEERARADRAEKRSDEERQRANDAERRVEELTGEITELRWQLEVAGKRIEGERVRAEQERELRGGAHKRVQEAERQLADKDALVTGLVAEKQALREQISTLTELLAARRAWWRRIFGG